MAAHMSEEKLSPCLPKHFLIPYVRAEELSCFVYNISRVSKCLDFGATKKRTNKKLNTFWSNRDGLEELFLETPVIEDLWQIGR
jgi:hypothetical protein